MKQYSSSNDITQQNPERKGSMDRELNFDSSLGLYTRSQQFKKRSFIIQSKNIKTMTKESFEQKLTEI